MEYVWLWAALVTARLAYNAPIEKRNAKEPLCMLVAIFIVFAAILIVMAIEFSAKLEKLIDNSQTSHYNSAVVESFAMLKMWEE